MSTAGTSPLPRDPRCVDDTDGEPLELVDQRLDRQLDYQKFHIGIYLSLASAIIGGSAFFGDKLGQVPFVGRAVLALAIFFLMLAGACAGMVAVRIPRSPNYDYFARRRYAVGIPGTKKVIGPAMCAHEWEAWEHGFFWTGMALLTVFSAVLLLAGSGGEGARLSVEFR